MTTYNEWIEAGSVVGRQQAFAIVASHSSAAQAACLKELKQTYSAEVSGISWDQFCEQYLAISRTQVDRLIARYDEFGETYFRLSQLARVSPQTYREIAHKIEDGVLEFEDEKIPLTADNVPKIRIALKKLRAGLRAARAAAQPHESLSNREFRMRVDVIASEVHNAACVSLNAAELETYRGMCAYAKRIWSNVADTISRINRPAA